MSKSVTETMLHLSETRWTAITSSTVALILARRAGVLVERQHGVHGGWKPVVPDDHIHEPRMRYRAKRLPLNEYGTSRKRLIKLQGVEILALREIPLHEFETALRSIVGVMPGGVTIKSLTDQEVV